MSSAITVGTLIGYLQINPVRDDPYRGDQAVELRRELESKIFASERRVAARITSMEGHLSNRLESIESHDQQLLQAVIEMQRAMEKLPPDKWERLIESLRDHLLTTDPTYRPPR